MSCSQRAPQRAVRVERVHALLQAVESLVSGGLGPDDAVEVESTVAADSHVDVGADRRMRADRRLAETPNWAEAKCRPADNAASTATPVMIARFIVASLCSIIPVLPMEACNATRAKSRLTGRRLTLVKQFSLAGASGRYCLPIRQERSHRAERNAGLCRKSSLTLQASTSPPIEQPPGRCCRCHAGSGPSNCQQEHAEHTFEFRHPAMSM